MTQLSRVVTKFWNALVDPGFIALMQSTQTLVMTFMIRQVEIPLDFINPDVLSAALPYANGTIGEQLIQ